MLYTVIVCLVLTTSGTYAYGMQLGDAYAEKPGLELKRINPLQRRNFRGVKNWLDKKDDERKAKDNRSCSLLCDIHERINIHNYKQLVIVSSQVDCI